jgi:hypothetical protein
MIRAGAWRAMHSYVAPTALDVNRLTKINNLALFRGQSRATVKWLFTIEIGAWNKFCTFVTPFVKNWDLLFSICK